MSNTTDRFATQVRAAMKQRGLTQVRVALDLGENPISLSHLLSGYRPRKRLREKLARYLGINGGAAA